MSSMGKSIVNWIGGEEGIPRWTIIGMDLDKGKISPEWVDICKSIHENEYSID